MAKISIPGSLYSRFETLAEELDGFNETEELLEYILSESADELEEKTIGNVERTVDDDAVQDRLKQLGYVE